MNLIELIGWGSIAAALAAAFVLGVAPVFVCRLIVAIYPKDDSRRPELIATTAHEAKKGLRNVPSHWYLLGYMFGAAIVEGLPLRWRQFRDVRRRIVWRRSSIHVHVESEFQPPPPVRMQIGPLDLFGRYPVDVYVTEVDTTLLLRRSQTKVTRLSDMRIEDLQLPGRRRLVRTQPHVQLTNALTSPLTVDDIKLLRR